MDDTTYSTERAFLAGVLAEPNAIAGLADAVEARDFGDPALAAVWAAIVVCHRDGELPEPPAVMARVLPRNADLLAELATEGATAANCSTYAARIREHGVSRRLRALGERLAQTPTDGTREAMDAAQADLDALREARADTWRLVDMAALGTVEVPRPEFVVDPLIPRAQTTLLGGHGGAGKSLLALTLGAHVAAGRDWAGFPIWPGKVLFVSMEDGADVVLHRLQKVARAYGLPLDAMTANLSIIDASESGPLAVEATSGRVRDLAVTTAYHRLAACVDGVDLVIVDNASDAYGGDEINRRQVRHFIKSLNKLVRPHGGACVLLAHIDKAAARHGSNGNTYSGSTAWHNSVRSRLALLATRDGEPELHHEKLNLGKRLDKPLPLAWTETGVLLPSDGRSRASDATRVADDAAVLAALTAAIKAGESIPPANTGPATSWHKLRIYPEMPDHLREKSGKRVFDEAMLRLQRAGKIERESYTDRHRNGRERWALRQCASMRVSTAMTQHDAEAPAERVNAQGGMGGLTQRSINAGPDLLPFIFGTKAHLTDAALTQAIIEQTGIEGPGAEGEAANLILGLVRDGELVRKRNGYSLPSVEVPHA
ncbi:AAA family ATPase [Thiohalocapsa marina]|uniref:AAA family ATPase n=1 Tax=Thiohalocapsa marina TaxID=424902 RepID=UPI0036DAF3F4